MTEDHLDKLLSEAILSVVSRMYPSTPIPIKLSDFAFDFSDNATYPFFVFYGVADESRNFGPKLDTVKDVIRSVCNMNDIIFVDSSF